MGVVNDESAWPRDDYRNNVLVPTRAKAVVEIETDDKVKGRYVKERGHNYLQLQLKGCLAILSSRSEVISSAAARRAFVADGRAVGVVPTWSWR